VVSKRKRRRRAAALHSNYGQRMFGDVLSMASTVAESRKHMVSERLAQLASAARDFSSEIDDLPAVHDFADAVVSRIEKLAAYVDDTDVSDMLDDIASFARRQPGTTVALGVVAGLIATQLLRNRPASAVLLPERRSSLGAEGRRAR
jgi:hypothetical protein